MIVRIRQGAWYGDSEAELKIPVNWNFAVSPHHGAPEVAVSAITEAIHRPIGTKNLRELSAGKKNVVILTEDITRPMPCGGIFNTLLMELNEAGVQDSAVTVIIANGTHRPMTRHELVLKLGEQVFRRIKVLPHNCYDNLEHIGVTSRGTELFVNAFAAAADLLIGVGGVYPHGMAGYSGGGKIVLPGIAGIQSIEQNHKIQGSGYGNVNKNPIREDMEEAARLAGLSFIVNAVINGDRRICGLYAGEPVSAHREAVQFADEVYRTYVPFEPDVAIVNAYPMDTELFQAGKAFGVCKKLSNVKVLVLLAACPDGFGYHALCGPGGRFSRKERDTVRNGLGGRLLVVCSENVGIHDVRKKYPDDTQLCGTWEDVVDVIVKELGCGRLNVALFPSATLQLPAVLREADNLL